MGLDADLNGDKNSMASMASLLLWVLTKMEYAAALLLFIVFWWNGLKIMIPKRMWKSKIRLLEQILDENRYVTFF